MLVAMALKPVARRLVPEDVFDQLLGEVVDGELAAGDSLPSERRLAEVLGVSRPAVREALQRLSQARLVEVRHGGSTTVRDFRTSAGLDLLPRLLVRDGDLDPTVGRSILQARQAIAPAVAALAAETAGPAAAEALRRRRGGPGAGRGLRGPAARRAGASGTPSSTPPTRSSSGCSSTACGSPTSPPSPRSAR